jgi:hypothetical protein
MLAQSDTSDKISMADRAKLFHVLTEALGGTLEIASLLGEGTTVTVRLPCGGSAAAEGGTIDGARASAAA